MTETNHPSELVKRAGRAALGPITSRLDHLRRDMELVWEQQATLSAAIEQAVATTERLEAYLDRFREEVLAETGGAGPQAIVAELVEGGDPADAGAALRRRLDGPQAIVTELVEGGDPAGAGAALRQRLDHGLLHAEAVARVLREDVGRQLGDLRSSTRLTQSLVERALAVGDGPPAADEAPSVPPADGFTHATPTFDLLYRAFEDRHRGDPTAQQREDYLQLIRDLPHPELPVADLGCGRGELVRVLDDAGITAVGVDANHGQIGSGEERLFVVGDLFAWLDEQPDGSHRALLAMHVVEHLPLDLQIRLIFEARRVLAPGGALVVETPNALSLSTAATNFWVDPTHVRPVHPLLLEFLADEAGFHEIEHRPLHPLEVSFRGGHAEPDLVADLQSLILGAGDLALIAWR
jgi:SAM-dependent methyltransferase